MQPPRVALKVRNFKCFGDEASGFDTFKPMNLVVGRNNSGKSSLLDLLELVAKSVVSIPAQLHHQGKASEVICQGPLTKLAVEQVFPKGTRGGGLPEEHGAFGRRLLGATISWRLDQPVLVKPIGPSPDGETPLEKVAQAQRARYTDDLVRAMGNPFTRFRFARITAERDLVPEKDSGTDFTIGGDGSGVTDAIQGYINKATLPGDLVETQLLDNLNRVFGPDAVFSDIVVQQLGTGEWEIYLEEEFKGRIPLSHSGSGLKTVVIILAHLILLPRLEKKDLGDYVLAIEEPENNLHPALLRRLLDYLFREARDDGPMIVVTTHSSVAIDMFGRSDDAQIVHVTHDGRAATTRTVATYIDNNGILDDLDVRASDLLQANCIVWVEGPSDRIYVNRWIELSSEGEIQEGLHYQCVFYGGRLLAHLSAEEPDQVDDGIAILRVNRRAWVIMDSDKRAQQTRISEAKKRVHREVSTIGGFVWLTKGREIENYLSAAAVEGVLASGSVEQIGRYEDFADYLASIDKVVGRRFVRQKALFAERIAPHIESLEVLDLGDRVRDLCDRIRAWNNLKVA